MIGSIRRTGSERDRAIRLAFSAAMSASIIERTVSPRAAPDFWARARWVRTPLISPVTASAAWLGPEMVATRAARVSSGCPGNTVATVWSAPQHRTARSKLDEEDYQDRPDESWLLQEPMPKSETSINANGQSGAGRPCHHQPDRARHDGTHLALRRISTDNVMPAQTRASPTSTAARCAGCRKSSSRLPRVSAQLMARIGTRRSTAPVVLAGADAIDTSWATSTWARADAPISSNNAAGDSPSPSARARSVPSSGPISLNSDFAARAIWFMGAPCRQHREISTASSEAAAAPTEARSVAPARSSPDTASQNLVARMETMGRARHQRANIRPTTATGAATASARSATRRQSTPAARARAIITQVTGPPRFLRSRRSPCRR